jgi:cytidylate kinase
MTAAPDRPGGRAMAKPMIIAIDGPAGAGKSSVTRTLAHRLEILYLDTGAMYRAATVGLIDAGVNLDDARAVAEFVRARHIDFTDKGEVVMDGEEVSKDRLRSPATTAQIYRVANHSACREHLVHLQQQLVAHRDAVVEGRDATTVICPDAQLKVYLDATVEERARRRLEEWRDVAEPPSFGEVVADIRRRDDRDMNRDVGALKIADDALHMVTDGLSINEVIAKLLAYAVQRNPFLLEKTVSDQLLVGRSRQAGFVKVIDGDDAPWQLGLTNPSPERMPTTITSFARNHGGRQAAMLCQGMAVMCLAGRGDRPGHINALPILPQTWYVIEPETWHAVIQAPGTICAWAEAREIKEEQKTLTAGQLSELRAFLSVYLPK